MADSPRLEDLRRRVQKDPASIAFAQLAEEYRRLGQFKDAVSVSRAGLQIHPAYVSARVTLGRALLALKRDEEAEIELERVLDMAPENLAAIRGLAELYQRRGDAEQALAQYEKALALVPGDPDLLRLVRKMSPVVEPAKSSAVPPAVASGTLRVATAARAARTIAALEQWLTAIHVARTQRST